MMGDGKWLMEDLSGEVYEDGWKMGNGKWKDSIVKPPGFWKHRRFKKFINKKILLGINMQRVLNIEPELELTFSPGQILS